MKRIALALMVIVLALYLMACGNETLPTGSQPTQGTQHAGTNVPSTQPTTVVTHPTEPAHIHEWSEATCTLAKTCKTCGETDGEALGHNWQDATCTTPKTCLTCNTTEGEVLDHTWDNGVVLKEATEDADGKMEYTCTACGEKKTQVIPSVNHEHYYSNINVTKPTCTEEGYTTYTCKCGDSYVADKTAVLGHDWAAATCTEPKTCITCGATDGTENGHNWNAATCTAPKTCATCGTTEGTALGHNWAPATCTEPMTCKTCSATEGNANGHDWIAATCTEPKTCKTCGTTEGVANGHNWNPATCTAPKTCTTCGATEGGANGHNWIAATCTEPMTCRTCGVTEGIAAGHKEVSTIAIAPTCTESGLTAGKYCYYCGVVLLPQETVPATGHNYIDGYCCICNSQARLLLFDRDSFIAYADDFNTLFDMMIDINGEYVIKLADGISHGKFTLDQEEWPACQSISFVCDNDNKPHLFIQSNLVAGYKLNSDLLVKDLSVYIINNKTDLFAKNIIALDLNGHDLTIDTTFLDFYADIYNSSNNDSSIYAYATYNDSHENYVDGGPWLYGNIECENFVAYGFVRIFGSVNVDHLEAHKQIALQANDERAIDCNIDIDRFIIHSDLNFKGDYFDSIRIHSLINESDYEIKLHIQGMDLSRSTIYIDNIEGNDDVVFYYATYQVVVFWDITVGGDMDFDFSQNPDGTYTVYYPLKNGDCFIYTDMSDLDVTVFVINEDGSGKSLQLSYNKDGYYHLEQEAHETIESAAEALREGMVERQAEISIKMIYDGNPDDSVFQEIFDFAVRHTGIPSEGDFIQWHFEGCSWCYDFQTDENGKTILTITYLPIYYTTAEQEAELDVAVEALLDELDLWDASDYEKICGVYEWICQNVTYDYANLNDVNYKLKFTAYAALIDRTAVCQGYSTLLYRLLLELGIDNRVITGLANGGAHAWNIVLLDGKYYNVDATWDSIQRQAGQEYKYFLLSDADFDDHIRDEIYASDAFYQKYPMHGILYNVSCTKRKYEYVI